MPLWGSEQYYKHFEDMTDKEKEDVANTYGKDVFSSGAPSIAWLAEAVKEQEKREKEEARLYEERYDYLDDVDDNVNDDFYDKYYDRDSAIVWNFDGNLANDSDEIYKWNPYEYTNGPSDLTNDIPYKRRFGDNIYLIHIIIYSVLVPNIPYLIYKFAERLNNWRFLLATKEMYVTLKYSFYFQHFYAISLMVFIMIYVDNRTKRYLDQKTSVKRTN